jgi:hypothetical protein
MDVNESQTQTASNEQDQSAAAALHKLFQQYGELVEYGSHFIHAKLDGMKVSIRQAAVWTILGLMGGIALVAIVVTAIVLLLTGLATGVGFAFGGKLWLGSVVVGLLCLIILSLGCLAGVHLFFKRSREQKVQYYGERQLQQRVQFGHNAADHATEAPVQ